MNWKKSKYTFLVFLIVTRTIILENNITFLNKGDSGGPLVCDSNEETSDGVRYDPNNFIHKGSSINDVGPKGRGRGVPPKGFLKHRQRRFFALWLIIFCNESFVLNLGSEVILCMFLPFKKTILKHNSEARENTRRW